MTNHQRLFSGEIVMQVLVFQHEPFEGLGAMAPWLKAQGAQVRILPQFEPHDEVLPDPESLDLIVLLGGPMSVHETTIHPWLLGEKRYIRQALDKGRPMLGVCLGAQLIAEQLGAAISKNQHGEIGWWPIHWTDEAHTIWPQAKSPTRVYHWHGETFDLPKGAERLATSAACANQGFRYGECVVGLQFHLEMTKGTVEDLIIHGGHELVTAPFIADENTQLHEPASSYLQNQALMAELLGFLTKSCRSD
ncbi:type 1 glutamine amidotransferase [Halothiobacillus sp.]|uniref:type 1 glutamine amidotransferase n=1 Tax=Halothiobacillus sp. TaxID=1891311 RepID=UPI002AD2E3EB|nr:type 1 glutamine amidotransferase [Halothiobacillus sp.]